jgi:hypothetical protein
MICERVRDVTNVAASIGVPAAAPPVPTMDAAVLETPGDPWPRPPPAPRGCRG